MKYPALSLALTLTALAGPLLPSPARADVSVSFEFFRDSLSPYGDWVEVGDYGNCWRPSGVDEDWSPYTDGYWAYTDAGWTWVSYEDWGGITYHYGRWVRVSGEGWCWVPDYEWAPAWVSWRSSDEYVGWAPLPPEARWRPEVGFSAWVDTSYDIGPEYYRFCRNYDFGAPVISRVCLPRERNLTIIENTVNITNITYNQSNTVIFNGGPNYTTINRIVNRPIPALRLVRDDRPFARNGNRSAPPQRLQGNQLAVFAPRVTKPQNLRDFGVQPKRVIPADRVNHGWAHVQDPEAKQRLRQKFAQETKGQTPESAPARRVKPEDLAVLPVKSDPNAPSPVATGKNRNRDHQGGVAGEKGGRSTSPEGVVDNPAQPDRDGRPGRPDGDGGARLGKNKGDGKKGDAGETAGVPAGPNVPQVAPPAAGAQPDRPGRGPVAGDGSRNEKNERGEGKAGKGERPNGPQNGDGRAVVEGRPDKGSREEPVRNPDKETRKGQRDQTGVVQGPQDQPNRPKRADGEGEGRRKDAQNGPDAVRQTQEAAGRAAAERRQEAQQQQQAEAARQQEKENRVNEARRQQQQEASRQEQAAQQAKEARRQQQQQAEGARRQEEAAQQAREARRQQQQQEGAQQAREARRQQQQQEAAQQANEARRQQQQQAEGMRRQQEAAQQRANEARQQQAQQAQQENARRQQQQAFEAQRNMQRQQAQQQQQQQRQFQPQVIPQQPQAPQNGGNGQGRGGKKRLTPEEAAQMQRQGRF